MSIKSDSHSSRTFSSRHIGPRAKDYDKMLQTLGLSSLEQLVEKTVPANIRLKAPLTLTTKGYPTDNRDENEVLRKLKEIASANKIFRSFIGMGYYDTITPPVILRNIMENPGWYTQYTPYQPEISQGRLEALINYQTMVTDLTAMQIANASLLDEGTAAAEAMTLAHRVGHSGNKFFISDCCHPQTIAVVESRAIPLGIEIIIGDELTFVPSKEYFGILIQYPTTHGDIRDYRSLADAAHKVEACVIAATDLLALTLLTPPGEWGADIVVGSSQRFGVPLGFGGPHAAFMATKDEYKRQLPGRLIGVSKDSQGNPAYRLTLQTREQHIRRDKATSNICTAQVLLAVMAGMYAAYHGPEGLREIAGRVHGLTLTLAERLKALGYTLFSENFFDTVRVYLDRANATTVLSALKSKRFNVREYSDSVGISLDETVSEAEVAELLSCFASTTSSPKAAVAGVPQFAKRTSNYLTHPVFNSYQSETEMLRYITRLQAKDLSLTTSMIPLGSCTMKLNAVVEMIPVTWPEFGKIHPFAPADQTAGYQQMISELEGFLAEITGLPGVSLQPNAGSQGEYAGLLVIRAAHHSRGESKRNIALIPLSAHGTNPASAIMAGMEVISVACDEHGNIDLADLQKKASENKDRLACCMITYPSTHGVFEEGVTEAVDIIHRNGGLVYMDGANMNAQVGLCRPGDFGIDVCHLNLHKTFCIPHGGGGPGVGPIAVAQHLVEFLPGHPLREVGGETPAGTVCAAPWGSASILPIPWVYISLMGAEGLKQATEVAILNANYIAKRLSNHYSVLYTGKNGFVAHECIIDLREFKKTAGIEAEDFAKRLMDYGFHAPTMSWPVAGTMMIEPTESESLAELDRFCDALIAIHKEIKAIERGEFSKEDNPLKGAPHTAQMVTATEWGHCYSREQAAYPAPWLKQNKFWPAVGRIDSVYGDRNVFCSCIA